MIDFELSEAIQTQRQMVHAVAEQAMRPIAREYDEREHEKPWDFLNMMWQVSSGHPVSGGTEKKPRQERPERNLAMCVSIEELSWGDAGLYLSIPNTGLGGAAVAAAGTSEQKERFLARFGGGKPKWAAMAITEPGCGSDSSAIQTTAHRDGDHWVINGTKIFCTTGLMAAEKPEGFVVVWATLDRSAGRAAPHLAAGLDDGLRAPQQPRGVDGQGEGRPGRDPDHAEGGRDPGAARLLAPASPREVDARRQDQRHLRGHAADQPADRRAAHPRLFVEGAVVEDSLDLAALLARVPDQREFLT